jgi:HEAT repeat protein
MEDDVAIKDEKEALEVLDNFENSTSEREEAARYLEENPSEDAIQRLIKALTDDDFGVRWASSTALTKLGDHALPALLQALINDPSPRMRESAYHVLHYNYSLWIQSHSKPLMDAIKDLAPDVTTPKAAYQMLREFEARGKTDSFERSTKNLPDSG